MVQTSSSPRRPLLRYVCGLVLFAVSTGALKFDLAPTHGQERCIRNFVGADTLVVVTATVSGEKGDGMSVNMNVSPDCLLERCLFLSSYPIPSGACHHRSNDLQQTDQGGRRLGY